MKRIHALCVVCFASSSAFAQQKLPIETDADRIPKTHTGGSCLITHGKVYTISGAVIENGDVLIRDGKIARVGRGLSAPAGVKVIDAAGKVVLPGLIDAHSHRGESATNEFSDSAVPEVQIRD